MTGLDFFALIVLFILLVAAIAIWVVLAALPGRIARNRKHPQAEAINVGGWLGALLGGLFWPIVLVWAFTVSRITIDENRAANSNTEDKSEFNEMENRLNALEQRIGER